MTLRERMKLGFALLGVLLLTAYAMTEIAHNLGLTPVTWHLPWGLLLVAALLVAPFTLGTAWAGRAWTRLLGRISSQDVTIQKHGPPTDRWEEDEEDVR